MLHLRAKVWSVLIHQTRKLGELDGLAVELPAISLLARIVEGVNPYLVLELQELRREVGF